MAECEPSVSSSCISHHILPTTPVGVEQEKDPTLCQYESQIGTLRSLFIRQILSAKNKVAGLKQHLIKTNT